MRQYVGEKRGRLEGMDKATGRALYAGDYRMENMLELALVRSEISHGSVRTLDVSALPEDVLVFTGKDFAENVVADIFCDTPVLAYDRIRFRGEPIAIIAADTREKAKEAAYTLGVGKGIDPFMTLSFMALPVIPTLRLTTRGVVDVLTQQYV